MPTPNLIAVRLRAIAADDLPALFDIQADPAGNEMAGTKARSREAFFALWEQIFCNPDVSSRAIEIDGQEGPQLVGSISRFAADGQDNVGYWIARPHWGRGIAGRALTQFLNQEPRRPLHATTVRTNAASQHILHKCGFELVGHRMGESTERFIACEISDFVLR